MLAALVKAFGACSGIGAAWLPLRKETFFGDLLRRSQMDGNSGEDEISTMESL
jgi:hypothetical protein